MPKAHALLGGLLKNQGRLDAAAEQYQELLRIRPDSNEAQLDLGIVLAEKGEMAAAIQYLQRAAKGSDPAVRQQANEVLLQITQGHKCFASGHCSACVEATYIELCRSQRRLKFRELKFAQKKGI